MVNEEKRVISKCETLPSILSNKSHFYEEKSDTLLMRDLSGKYLAAFLLKATWIGNKQNF